MDEDYYQKIDCFICSKVLKEQSDDILFEDLFRSYEQHMLNVHSIIIPRYQSVNEFIDFIQNTRSLDQLEAENRCKRLTYKKFNKIINYLIIDKQLISDEMVIKNVVENHFLQRILNEAQKQRMDENFSHQCLFCRKNFQHENRLKLFKHLSDDHNFFIGHPDNIVDAEEFIDTIDEKLKQLLCLYCERKFKNWNVLKEHMRKKGHKTLNPNNHEYDRFYLINYLCNDKHWKQIKKENDFYIDNDDDDWNDWIDDDDSDENRLECQCFFCPYKSRKFENIRQHFQDEHDLNFFDKIFQIEDFYERIMIVNYIRKNIQLNQCYICHEKFNHQDGLMEHLTDTNHQQQLPQKKHYHSFEYYFPVIDNDCLLMFLDDFDL